MLLTYRDKTKQTRCPIAALLLVEFSPAPESWSDPIFTRVLILALSLLDFKSSCVIKNRRKASKVKVLKFIDQNSALGCLSDQRLTKKQHQGNISQHIYRYVSTCVVFSLAARTVQPASPSLFSSSCKTTCDSLPPSVSAPLSTDTKHSTVMYVCGGIFPTSPWYRMFSQCVLLCFLCACSFFKLPLCGFSLHTRLLTHTPFHNVSKNTSVTAHSIILPASTVIKL